jgi:hypothetical protein
VSLEGSCHASETADQRRGGSGARATREQYSFRQWRPSCGYASPCLRCLSCHCAFRIGRIKVPVQPGFKTAKDADSGVEMPAFTRPAGRLRHGVPMVSPARSMPSGNENRRATPLCSRLVRSTVGRLPLGSSDRVPVLRRCRQSVDERAHLAQDAGLVRLEHVVVGVVQNDDAC